MAIESIAKKITLKRTSYRGQRRVIYGKELKGE
jgi:hypothetical protein